MFIVILRPVGMDSFYKIDLHTHSIGSDGKMKAADYEKILKEGVLDYVAITDHNEISYALEVQKNISLGNRMIVGEEILTGSGEIIGLYLKEKISSGMGAVETIKAIKDQNGLVYIPHPFDWIRYGMLKGKLKRIIDEVDIIEIFNPKYILPGGNKRVRKFVESMGKVGAASSDTHMVMDIGRSYSVVDQKPNRENLVDLLKNAEYSKKYVPKSSYLWQVGNLVKRAMKGGHFKKKKD